MAMIFYWNGWLFYLLWAHDPPLCLLQILQPVEKSGNSSNWVSVRAGRSRWWAARASPTTVLLRAHPLTSNRSRKTHLTAVLQQVSATPRPRSARCLGYHAPPRRLGDRASSPPSGISTAPERSNPSSSLSTTPLAPHGVLECVDPPCTTGHGLFAKCKEVCRVLNIGHSAKPLFAECCARQRKALGKGGFT
jgi:hypothetical protein